MPRRLLPVGLLLIICLGSAGQETTWNKKKCAVVLTYDDALEVHLDNVVPLLDSLNLKGSFYLSTAFNGFQQRVADWKKIATRGHELANHSIFHPCTGGPGRQFVKKEYDLSTYSMQRITDELRVNNTLLEALDGKKKRTFAYPCGDIKIGDSLYLIRADFAGARTTKREMQKLNDIDVHYISCFTVNGSSGEEMIGWVKQAMETNSLIVFLFHGVGGGHSINVSLDAHRKLLQFLKQQEKDIWIAPLIDVTEYVVANKKP